MQVAEMISGSDHFPVKITLHDPVDIKINYCNTERLNWINDFSKYFQNKFDIALKKDFLM